MSFRLVPRPMTLNDIWRSFPPTWSFPHPIAYLEKLLIRNHTAAFRWYGCRWPCRYFKVIRLFHVKFPINGALYGISYNRVLIRNHTLAIDWCFWWPWMTFEGHFSLDKLPFPRPVSQKLYKIRPHESFKWYLYCRRSWLYFKVIRLFHVKFLVNGALYSQSYYRVLIGNHTLAFDWRIFEGHFSLGCHFHVQYLRNYIRYS